MILVDLDDVHATQLGLAMDARYGHYDDATLSRLIHDLTRQNTDLDDTGLPPFDVDRLLREDYAFVQDWNPEEKSDTGVSVLTRSVSDLGPNFGTVQEGTLKLKEMTQTVCESYGPLEFRHGPISVVGNDTVVVLLEVERERIYVGDLEVQLEQYGARVASIAPFEPAHGGPWLELPGSLCVLALVLDPDRPRNLTQVVEPLV